MIKKFLEKKTKSAAYRGVANLHNSITDFPLYFDYGRFRGRLFHKYHMEHACECKVKIKNRDKKNINQKGSILAELLLAIALLVVIGAFGAQFAGVSLISGENAKERGAAVRLAEEGLDVVRAISQGNDVSSQGWNRIYRPPDGMGDSATSKGSAHPFHPVISGPPEQWTLVSGSEAIVLENETYTRSVVIDNVSRDTNANIEVVYDSSNDDPGTQKVTVTVSKSRMPDIVLTEYVTRFLNESSLHSDWSGVFDCNSVPATGTPSTYCGSTCVDRTGTPGSVKLATSC